MRFFISVKKEMVPCVWKTWSSDSEVDHGLTRGAKAPAAAGAGVHGLI